MSILDSSWYGEMGACLVRVQVWYGFGSGRGSISVGVWVRARLEFGRAQVFTAGSHVRDCEFELDFDLFNKEVE